MTKTASATDPAQSSEEQEVIGSKQRRRAESDRRMLRAAAKLIGRHGTVGASLAMIGVEAGYSRGLPAQRFGSKLNLLEAVIDAVEERFLHEVEQRTSDKQGCDALAERIRLQIVAVHDWPESAIALYHLIVDSFGTVPELKPRIRKLLQAYRTSLNHFLDEAERLGELRDDINKPRMVRTISGTISGICIQALADDDTARLKDDADFIANLFVSQIRKPGGIDG